MCVLDLFYNGQLVCVFWGANESNPQLAHFVDFCLEPEFLFQEPHCKVMTTHLHVYAEVHGPAQGGFKRCDGRPAESKSRSASSFLFIEVEPKGAAGRGEFKKFGRGGFT